MIVQFHVSNFRSFDSEEQFSLVASKRLMGHLDDHTIELPHTDDRVLKAGMVYGANGSGKSNLCRALHYFQWLALSTKRASGTGRTPHAFSDGAHRPTEFDLIFLAGGKLLRYGVSVEDDRIREEWLSELVGGREMEVYGRTTDPLGKVTVSGKGLAACGTHVALAAQLGGKQNHTFLATVNHIVDRAGIQGEVGLALEWFESGLALIGPDASFGPIGEFLFADGDLMRFATEILESAGTGIESLEVNRVPIEEFEFLQRLDGTAHSDFESDRVVVSAPDGREYVKQGNEYFAQEIVAWHKPKDGKRQAIRFEDESDGTKKLLALIPALHDLKNRAAVYVIDELDRSLHPLMVREFLRRFLSDCSGGMRQLISTTHESRLLDLDLLRRDEIWFAEKDADQATRLYSLADFKVRKDFRIDKGYLQGRFGAVPFLGDMQELVEEEQPTS